MSFWSQIRMRRGWMIVLALIPFAILIVKVWAYQPDIVYGDWVQYMLHAEALLDGRPYTDIGYLFNEASRGLGPRAYPPGLPIILAGAFAVFGANLIVAKVVAVAMAVSFLVVSGIYFARSSYPVLGVGVVLLLGLSPRVLEFSVSPLSDIPFAAFIWLTILLVDREGDWDLKRALGVISAAGIAILVRPHGLVLIPALIVWGAWSWHRGRGRATLVPGAVLVVLTVLGRLVLPNSSTRAFPSISTLWHHLISPNPQYRFPVLESHLYPFGSELANDVYHVFAAVFLLVGLGAFVWRNPGRFAVMFGVSYALALAALPHPYHVRFAFPLYPLFVFGLLNGIHVSVRAIVPERAFLTTAVCAVGLSLLATGRGLATEFAPRRLDDPQMVGLVEHLAGRVRDGEKMRLVSFRPRYLVAATGAPGMVMAKRVDPDRRLRLWCEHGITDVVLGGFGVGKVTELARRTMALAPDAFTPVYSNADFEVFRMNSTLAGC